jgi:hypothetical protein
VRKTVVLSAAAPQCASGTNCVSYSTLGEPSKLSRGNPGPRCFACEKQRGELEVKAVAAKLKAAKHRQVKKPSRSEGYEPEVSRASGIRERRRTSVRTCERGLRSAIVSDDARLTRRWSRLLREARARLLWAEADLEASEKSAQSEQRR